MGSKSGDGGGMRLLAEKKIFYQSGFYTRKVKYTQETFCEKFQAILEGFPRLQDIHPFRKQKKPIWIEGIIGFNRNPQTRI